jgi:anaerobic magnesium-protoporphyrin IX monomethyl ester cyclase
MANRAKIKKVAFIYLTQMSEAYYLGEDIGYSVQRRPQLGFQYLCAVLEKKDVETNIFDQTVEPFDLDLLVTRLKEYDMAGFYCSDPHEEKVKEWSRRIRERTDIPILVGGPSTLTNTTFLDHGCDIIVHGEGELTIQEVVDYYNGAMDIENIKGISYRKGDLTVTASPRELIEDLDSIPFPDRSKIDINAYFDYFLFNMRKPYITIIATRGCPYKCSFCTSYQIWGCEYRRRSVNNVIAEIDNVVEKYNARYVAFQDDVFGMANDWIEEFCHKLINRPYKIRWMAILHPFSFRTATERILRLMRRAGCDTISFGLQSAHPEILRNINRDPGEPDALRRLLKIADGLGFLTAVSYVFGLPGDTQETIKKTSDYSLDCCSTVATYYILSVLRGSDIEKAYGNKQICSLTDEEIEGLTERASKRFYTRPKAVLKLAYFIMKNPEWLMNVSTNLPSILSRIGFGKKKARRPGVLKVAL